MARIDFVSQRSPEDVVRQVEQFAVHSPTDFWPVPSIFGGSPNWRPFLSVRKGNKVRLRRSDQQRALIWAGTHLVVEVSPMDHGSRVAVKNVADLKWAALGGLAALALFFGMIAVLGKAPLAALLVIATLLAGTALLRKIGAETEKDLQVITQVLNACEGMHEHRVLPAVS